MGWNFHDLDEIGDICNLSVIVKEVEEIMNEEKRQYNQSISPIQQPHFFG